MVTDTSPTSQSNIMKLVAETRQMVEQRKAEVPLAGVRALAGMQRRTFDLSSRLRDAEYPALIAKLKPAQYALRPSINGFSPPLLAKHYESGGVSAITVTTAYEQYHSTLANLTRIAQSSQIPVIRQDFIYDEYQVVEARAAGADAVFLMAALLNPPMLRNLISITQRNRMTAVVQVQSREELQDVIEYEPRVIAISNRDMHSFDLDFDNTARLRPFVPSHMAIISVNGFETVEQVQHVLAANIHGVLVGQRLLSQPEFATDLKDLFHLQHELIP